MEKIYVGDGKEKVFNDGGSVINVTLELDDLNEHFKNYGFVTKGGKHCLKLKVNKRRSEGTYGETHSITVDTWKPEPKNEPVTYGDGTYKQS